MNKSRGKKTAICAGLRSVTKRTRANKTRTKSKIIPTGRTMPVMDWDLFQRDKWKALQVYRAQLWEIADFDILDLFVEDDITGRWRNRRPRELGAAARRIVTEIEAFEDGRVFYHCLSKRKAMHLLCNSFVKYGDPPKMNEARRHEIGMAFITSPWMVV